MPLPPSTPVLVAIGTGEILREAPQPAGDGEGGRVALLGYGTGVGKALEAAALLELDGIAATVADARFAKPIDSGLVAQLAAEHELLVTIEEGVLGGGFGSAVWEALNEAGGPPDADPARRRPGPLRHPRRAGAAARGDRLHRRADRRARARRDRPPGRPRRAPSSGRERRRLDTLLAQRGLFESRSPRRRRRCSPATCGSAPPATAPSKPGQLVALDVELAVDDVPRFVSRGGIKLANALAASGLDVTGAPLPGRRRLDRRLHRLPARGGGRARRRPRRRLRRVLSWRLRGDPRVTVIERTNARELAPAALPYAPEVIVADVSFISLRTVLPAVLACAAAALRRALPSSSRSSRSARASSAAAASCATSRCAAARCWTSPRPHAASAPRVRGFHTSGLPGPKGNIETFIALAEGARGDVGDLAGGAGGRPGMRSVTHVLTHGRPDQTRERTARARGASPRPTMPC